MGWAFAPVIGMAIAGAIMAGGRLSVIFAVCTAGLVICLCLGGYGMTHQDPT